MSIRNELVIGFLMVALPIVAIGYRSLTVVQKASLNTVAVSLDGYARLAIDGIQSELQHRLEGLHFHARTIQLAGRIGESNRTFDEMSDQDRESHIADTDKDWIAGQQTPHIQGILENELSQTLEKNLKDTSEGAEHTAFAEIFVTNKFGTVVAASGRTSDYAQAEELWYQNAVADGCHWISNVEYDDSADTWAMTLAIVLKDEQGNFAGVVKGVLSARYIQKVLSFVQDHAHYDSTVAYLVDNQGRVLLAGRESASERTDRTKQTKQDIGNEDFGKDLSRRIPVAEALKKKTGYLVFNDRGTEKLAAFHSPPVDPEKKGSGWALVIECDTADVQRGVLATKRFAVLASILVTIFTLSGGIVFARSISLPIKRLTMAANEISQGYLNVETEDLGGRAEIGVLAQAFKIMTEKLIVANEELDSRGQAINFAHAELNQIFNAALPMRVISRDSVVLRVNESFCKLFGKDREALRGQACRQCTDMLSCEVPHSHHRDLFLGKEQIEHEVATTLADGREICVLVSAVPFRDPNGEVIGVVEAFVDITERKTDEENRKSILLNMGERVKELSCMYGVAESVRKHENLGDIFVDVCELIPSGCRYSEITRAKITFEGESYTSEPYTDEPYTDEPFKETEWKLTADIIVGNARYGSIDVYYMEERPELDVGPFSEEEHNLINGIAQTLGEVIQRHQTQQQLADYASTLEFNNLTLEESSTEREELLNGLESKNRELEQTQQRLAAAATFSSALNQTDTSEVYEAALRAIADETGAPLVAVYANSAEHGLVYKHAVTLDTKLLDRHELSPEGLPAAVERDQGMVMLSGPFDTDQLNLRIGLGEVRVHGIVGWPILFQNRCVGVLLTVLVRPLSDQQNELIEAHLRQLAIRMKAFQTDDERIHLLAELQSQAHALELAKDDAEKGNRAKSEFLANMSHELRTPMNSILGFSERLMVKEADDPLGKRDIEALEIIDRNARHLLELINSILDLSKIEAGRTEVRLAQFDLLDAVRDVVTQNASLTQDKPIELVADLPGKPVSVVGDRTKIIQVITNLIANAVKFTDEGKVIATVTQGEDEHLGEIARVSIRDTGVGIKSEDLDRLFTKFTQLDGSATRRAAGTGLGLCIAQQYAQLHGGRIDVQSKFGQGSTFTLVLPLNPAARPLPQPVMATSPKLAKSESKAAPAGSGIAPAGSEVVSAESSSISSKQHEIFWEAESEPRLGSLTVLCVDDEPDTLELMRVTLEEAGYSVLLAESHDAAVEKAKNDSLDVICLDIEMPEKDGFSLMETLQDDPDLANVPVIVVSMTNTQSKALEAGARYYLPKPILAEQLLATVQHVLVDEDSKVLVVEDDPDTSHLVTSILKEHGIAVQTACNGKEALDRLAESVPTTILLDLMMPVMDGIQFLEYVQTDPAFKEIPVIILTAKILDEQELAKLKEMSRAILIKGWTNSEQLIDSVLKLLAPPQRLLEETAV